ncbi:MAG: hypothetical protein M5R40_17765 [Anaerolineae bacterium]|nr:hypothetical protein [Anaerolineae bacterium]
MEIIFTPEGQAIFSDYTASHIGEVLGIVIDGRVITAPRIQQAITVERVLLTGSFTDEEARVLAIQLRYGALPVPLALESVEVFAPAEAE